MTLDHFLLFVGHLFLVGLLVFAIGLGVAGFLMLFGGDDIQLPPLPKRIQAEIDERKLEKRGDPAWEPRYADIVWKTRQSFLPPTFHVWGQYIQDGSGYAVFVTTEDKKTCLHLRSQIKVNETEVDNDILSSPDLSDTLRTAWSQMRKGLNGVA